MSLVGGHKSTYPGICDASDTIDRVTETYTARLRRVTAILAPHLDLTNCIVSRPDPDDYDPTDRWVAMWADHDTGLTQLAVYIDVAEDQLASLRADVRGESYLEPGSVVELTGCPPGTYVLVKHYANAIVAIVDGCHVEVFATGSERLRQPAIEIAKTVGCQPYTDDFVKPPYPDHWRSFGWTAYPNA